MGHPQSHDNTHLICDEVRSCQYPLLWTWVLEKMGMLEITERLANKQHGDTRFTQVQAPRGKTLLLLVCSDYGGTEGYRGAQMQSGVEVCMRKIEREPPRRALLVFI